jgi:PilZ domain-containing protein
MSGFCDRCNERTSQIVNITQLPEVAAVAHLGYRQVCGPCYDDLVAEASEARDSEERDEDRRAEPRVKVSMKARVEGNTSHLASFADEMNIEEISPSGLRLHTSHEIEPGTLLKVSLPTHDVDTTAIVETVWHDGGQRIVGLKLVEPSEGWERLWQQHATD